MTAIASGIRKLMIRKGYVLLSESESNTVDKIHNRAFKASKM
jgi:hypothetical protein